MVEILAPHPVPGGLLDAFWAYDRALLANDTATLAALFAPGPDTLRGDGSRVLVGHDEITGFRAGRTSIPTRRVTRVHVRPLAPDTALVVAETASPDGRSVGLQTQVWRAVGGRWRVCAAHVSAPPAPAAPAPAPGLDRAMWRVLGDPLLAGAPHGPLRGLTVAVKDLFAVRGNPVGAGNPAWLAEAPVAGEHAAAVADLLAEGAAVTGIARTDEFAYSVAGTNAHYGTPPNPAAPDRVSGGSSSGPASAVATGLVSVGLGTDTAGSIRVPASYQGLFGLRTTHGLVDRAGVLPLAPSFDTVGWLTRDASTLAAVADAVLPSTPRTPLRLGLVIPAVTGGGPVTAALTDAVRGLVDGGVLSDVDTADIPDEVLDGWWRAFRAVQGHEAWAAHGAWVEAHPGALGPDVAARFATAARVTADEAARARDVVRSARDRLRGLLGPGTVLLLPSASSAAPPRDTDPGSADLEAARAATLRMTCLAGLAGAPALSLPLAEVDGAPLGITAMGAPGADRDLLDLASRR
ncbi:MAG TPA: amidase [Pseudonocardia sp.]|jgi:Asp-tRNA(Asn)/Glu-tRNA(Gln) amidotransferase A subunit family amidase